MLPEYITWKETKKTIEKMMKLQRKSLEGPLQNGGWNGRPLPQRTKDSRNRETEKRPFLGQEAPSWLGPPLRAELRQKVDSTTSPTIVQPSGEWLPVRTIKTQNGATFKTSEGGYFPTELLTLPFGPSNRYIQDVWRGSWPSAGEEPQVWPAEQSWMLF